MSKKTRITEEERETFRKAVGKIEPLPLSNRALFQKPVNKKYAPSADYAIDFLLDKEPVTPIASVSSEEFLQFVRPGLQTRVVQRLKRGEFPAEAVLDLHGFKLVEAELMLQRFLAHAAQNHWRQVLIIHGKGARSGQGPVLKNSVNQWLRAYSLVLAFCSAQPQDGGTGAVYALLKHSQ
jgi:DNA-nicking Smr family endonuclease